MLIEELCEKRENKRVKEQMDLIRKIYEQNLEEDIIDATSYNITPDPDSYIPEFRKKQILNFTEFVETTSKGDDDQCYLERIKIKIKRLIHKPLQLRTKSSSLFIKE